MGERHSEYERVPADTYVTPRWVYEALYAVEPWAETAVDPCPVNYTNDFLLSDEDCWGFATNPPFKIAGSIADHALSRTAASRGKVALLLPMAWDCAKTRTYLFVLQPFKAKYVLTRRIRWENLEQKAAGPSANHAWFVWDWEHRGQPMMGWL